MKFHKETQACLNVVFGERLVVDGIVGEKTLSAKRRAIDKLLSLCIKKGWDRTEFINGVIAVRVDDNYTNTFSDYLIYLKPDLTDMYAIPASTKPGTVAVWKKGLEWIMGKQGVAVLKEGQIKKMWSKQGAWWSGLDFYWQRKEVDVEIYRDNIVDNKIDRHQIHKGQFGINGHSWKGWLSAIVSYWKDAIRKIGVSLSEGCIVAQASYWVEYEKDTTLKNKDKLISCNLLNLLYDF